jgi:hypothetical protein
MSRNNAIVFSEIRILLVCLSLVSPAIAQRSNGPSSLVADSSEGSTVPAAPAPAGTRNNPEIRPVTTTVEVHASQGTVERGAAPLYQITQQEVLSSAGTFEDFTRYLQVLPGVVWNSDVSNDVIVRGGHPAENLYVVDGIEIPNINHIEVEGSTGGFTSMIDTSSVGTVDLNSGAYDSQYSSRLSSLIDIHTRATDQEVPFDEISFGIGGVGGFSEYPVGNKGSLFLSGHRSLFDLVTTNIGLNGSPVLADGLGRLDLNPDEADKISLLNVSGADSIAITPCAGDPGESLLVDTQYSGMRSTTGAVWQHLQGPRMVSTLTGTFSVDDHGIDQQMQNPGAAEKSWATGVYCQATGLTQIYLEQTHDGLSSLRYNLRFAWKNWLASVGESGGLTSLNYNVAQPQGLQSPFSINPAWTDAGSFRRRFNMGETASYADITGNPAKGWTLMAGAREETFALTGAHTFNPRATASYRLNSHEAIGASWNSSSQAPPTIDILSFPQNAFLKPTRVDQVSLGANLWSANWLSARMQVFHKNYTDEPVSTQYPSLMLANMVDTLGQQFVWLPLRTGGLGRSQGIESMVRARLRRRLEFLGTATYSRTKYAAADGVLRSGNYDLPLVGNGLLTIHLPMALDLSIRDTYASGRPYTPFNIAASEAQFRGIYDMARVNALRGDAYNRFDFEVGRQFHIRSGVLTFNGGMQNAFDRGNFLGYVWLDRCLQSEPASNPCYMNGLPEAKVTQMPHFPSASVRYSFWPLGERRSAKHQRRESSVTGEEFQ